MRRGEEWRGEERRGEELVTRLVKRPPDEQPTTAPETTIADEL